MPRSPASTRNIPNLCFVDTLDNVGGARGSTGPAAAIFSARVSEENVARIKRQNARKICVIIGNPPYNANQLEREREQQEPRPIRRSTSASRKPTSPPRAAQKTKLYDMYARFFRWASDRIDENGIVAFVSNRSFHRQAAPMMASEALVARNSMKFGSLIWAAMCDQIPEAVRH